MVRKYEGVHRQSIEVDKAPNSRRIHLKSNYMRLERNDKTVCCKACILFKYSNDYLLIELDDETCRAVRAWRSARTGIFPMHTQYLALEAFHAKLVSFATVYANNLEPLCFSFTERMPSIVPVYHYDVAHVIRSLSESRGYHCWGVTATTNNHSSALSTSNNSSAIPNSGNGGRSSNKKCSASSTTTTVLRQRELCNDSTHIAEKRSKLSYDFYKSMDPSITYKDYLKIVQ